MRTTGAQPARLRTSRAAAMLLAGLAVVLAGCTPGASTVSLTETFPDEAIRECVADALQMTPDATVTTHQLGQIRELECDEPSDQIDEPSDQIDESSDRIYWALGGLELLTGLNSLSLDGPLEPDSNADGLDYDTPMSHFNLSPLTRLPQLETVRLAGGVLDNPEALASMPALKEFTLNAVELSDPAQTLQAIGELPHLTRLSLTWVHNLTTLDGLENLTSLRGIFLDRTPITSLAPLQNLQRLESVSANKTAIDSLAPLAHHQDLVVVNAAETGVADVSPLKTCPKLISLDITDTSVTDITPLSGLTELTIKS